MERIKLQIMILLCTSLQISNYSYLEQSTTRTNNNFDNVISFTIENDLSNYNSTKAETTELAIINDISNFQILLTFSVTVYMTVLLSIINSCMYAIQKRNQHQYRQQRNSFFSCSKVHNNIYHATHQPNFQKKSSKYWGQIITEITTWFTCCSFASFLCNICYILFYHMLVNQNKEQEEGMTKMGVMPLTWVNWYYFNTTKSKMITPDSADNRLINEPFHKEMYPWHLFTIWNYFKVLAIFIFIIFVWTMIYQLKTQKRQPEQSHDMYYWSQNNTRSSLFSFLHILRFWRPYHSQNHSYISNGTLGDLNVQNSIKENDWCKWDTETLLIWIGMQHKKQQQRKYDTACTDDITHLLQTLSIENINGKCLESITLSDLRSFGLSYGDAFWCRQQMHHLVSEYDRYERYNRAHDHFSNDIDDAFVNTIDDMTLNSTSHHTDDDIEIGQINEKAMTKAKEIMSERFGLSLPEINTDSFANKSPPQDEKRSDRHNNIESNLKDPPVNAMIQNTYQDSEARKDSDHSINDTDELPIPSEIFHSMPPNLQEIVRNRPDLVRQVMATTNNKLIGSHSNMERSHQSYPQQRQYHPIKKNLETIDESLPYQKKSNTFDSKERTLAVSVAAVPETNNNDLNSINDSIRIPTHIFNSMPPKIQEIVRNRPDLLQQVLNTRNRNTNTLSTSFMHKEIDSKINLKKQSKPFSKLTSDYNNHHDKKPSQKSYDTSHRKTDPSHVNKHHSPHFYDEDRLRRKSEQMTYPNSDNDDQGEHINLLKKM